VQLVTVTTAADKSTALTAIEGRARRRAGQLIRGLYPAEVVRERTHPLIPEET